MKTKTLVFALVLLSLIGCKKKDVDPVENYIENYQIPGIIKREETDDILIVSKSKPRWLALSFTRFKLFGELKANGKFTIAQAYGTEYDSNNIPYGSSTYGEGSFSDNTITLNVTTQSYPPGKVPYKQSSTVVCTKTNL
jgi:hypothetical protein